MTQAINRVTGELIVELKMNVFYQLEIDQNKDIKKSKFSSKVTLSRRQNYLKFTAWVAKNLNKSISIMRFSTGCTP